MYLFPGPFPCPYGFHKLQAAADAQLGKNMVQMFFCCILADDQMTADIFRRILLHDQAGNLTFPGSQPHSYQLAFFLIFFVLLPLAFLPFPAQADSQMIFQPVQYFHFVIGKIPLPVRPAEDDFSQQFPIIGQDDAAIKADFIGEKK